MTYSIVARDPDSGQFGVAVQTCWFAVGAIVPWARAGVGAVATQAMVEVSYGPKCLERLVAGADAAEALDEVRAADDDSDIRQVAVVDGAGGVSAHTGAKCIDHAGHHVGRAVLGAGQHDGQPRRVAGHGRGLRDDRRPLPRNGSWPRCAPPRRAGGDARGRMSAAVLIVDGERRDHPWEGVLVDVRVDHDDQPLDRSTASCGRPTPSTTATRAKQALFGGDPAAALAEVDLALGRSPATRTPASCGPAP